MAMLPQLFSLNGLATETRLDRRMVGNILANVRSDGKLNGKPAWHLSTFLRARERREAYSGRRSSSATDDSDLFRLEQAAQAVDTLLDELRGIPDIEERRRLLQSGRGHVIGELTDALARSRGFLSDNARLVSQPFADGACGAAIAELMQLCGWQIAA